MTQPANSRLTCPGTSPATSRSVDCEIADAYAGRNVVDDRGATVGTVAGVVYESAGTDPAWLLVEPRWRRTARYVPFEVVYPDAAGNLVVPFDRSWVRAAPRATSDAETLSYETRRRLATHYGDNYEWWPRRHASALLGSP